MKAIQITEPRKLEIVEVEKPMLKDSDEVMIKVKAAGICGSDVHIYHGTNPMATYPRIIGHEFTGEVVEVGTSVQNVAIGDKVVVEPILYCGECYACRSGRPNVCEKLEAMGVHVDGGMREFIVVPSAKAHKVSPDLPYEMSVVVEPFTIAAQSTWRGDVKKGETCLIMGAGPIGQAILQYALLKGATCIVSDIDNERLDDAKKLGATHVINPLEVDVVEKARELTGGSGPNVTIDSACTLKTFEQAVEMTSPAGRVVVLGFSVEPSKIAQVHITKKELTIVGSRLQTNKFGEVIGYLNTGALNPEGFVTHKFHFLDAQKAMDLVEDPSIKKNKVIITF
ncbi:zinc-binding alcohol dehydrogenase family protein [Proteiniclasticum sp. SCR006]|uniref:Zinc-binding alcohol dehydrogenase family protein n=1 Tax=Proteiniclasticum aestuarii TaxID=2817862 RepID=A0A939KL12_9CLOT|nr:zinc-binding alcohol dehydrogenase family protein [Proteiniclasticum aestuarii]MBO1265200.1 zinc-binding alcohol dehydrogenase family protein [Proteiniclasticum aestuarii]